MADTGASDAELVGRVREGDRDAAGRLVERYLRAARAVALSVLRDVDAAEDVCQDAFVYAIRRIDDCRDPRKVGAWLLTIVRNRSRNAVRDSKAARVVPIDRYDAAAGTPAPDRRVEQAEVRARLLLALGSLPQVRREVLLLHDLEGWTHDEIAARLQMPAGTIRSHLHYARRAMRKLLQAWLE